MVFKQLQYKHVERLIQQEKSIFNHDNGYGMFWGKPRSFALCNSTNNLYSKIVDNSLSYFAKNNISWWTGKLTNHTLSSQIACLNHLFLIRDDKQAVLSVIKQIEPKITDVYKLKTDKKMSGYIQFEAVSDTNHLNEKTSTRGSNCTSIDALIYGIYENGRKILFPIEWKYTEKYGNGNKAYGKAGATRIKRYSDLINNSIQLHSINSSIYYYEPFYQLMRQTLWAEQMITHKNTETISADDYIHIHVIPSQNFELIDKTYPCSSKNMEKTWRSCIKNQDKYIIVSPQDLLKSIDLHKYNQLLEYLNKRYWA